MQALVAILLLSAIAAAQQKLLERMYLVLPYVVLIQSITQSIIITPAPLGIFSSTYRSIRRSDINGVMVRYVCNPA
jgi:hypothetical protein